MRTRRLGILAPLCLLATLILAPGAKATPTAGNVSLTVIENASAAYPNVIAADSSPSGVLTVTAVSAPAHGTASTFSNTVAYTPATGYTGSDSFTYTVSDGNGSASATVYVTIIALPAPPAVRQMSAPMVTPANAWSHYGSSTTHTADPSWAPATPEIGLVATSLGAGRSNVTSDQFVRNAYAYVRNNIATEFRFGLGKGARGALIDGSGTPFDQAQLLVKLLQQGGVSASYQAGNVTLTAQQFGLWTGLFTGASTGAQTFTVSAQAACHFLADGGIAAIVNGVSDNGTQDYCNVQVSGNLSSVTMAHIWVSAGGYLLDPSFKQNTVQQGLDIASALSCGSASAPTCASSAASAAMSGASTGSIGPAPTIKNINEGAVLSQLTLYAQNLENNIKTFWAPNTPMQTITSGLLPNPAWFAANPPAGSLPYSAAANATWSGDIPDPFRTAVTYGFCSQSVSFYADVLSGRRLRRWLVAQPATTSSSVGGAGSARLVVSTYADGADIMDCSWPYGTPSFSPATTLTAQLPYAASGYGLISQTVYPVDSTLGAPVLPMTLVLQLGEATDSTPKFMGDLEGDDQAVAQANASTGVDTVSYINCSNTKGVLYGCNPADSTTAAHLMADQSRAAALAAPVASAALRHHLRLGYVSGGFFSSAQQVFDVASNISSESYTNTATATSAAFELFAHISSALEGSVSQQENSTWEPLSGSTDFVLENRGGAVFADVVPGNMGSVIASLTNYGLRTAGLQTLANAGYESIIPVSGASPCTSATSYYYCGVFSPDYEVQTGAVALLLDETLKGAGILAGTDPTAGPLAFVKQKAETRQSLHLGAVVDTASGQASLTPPPDIVTGTGDFPQSLPFQRVYQSGATVVERRDVNAITSNSTPTTQTWTYNGPDSKNADHLGGGWQHNYQITAQLDSDASLAMGDSRALDASGMITGVYVASQLLQNPTFANRMTALFADYWMAKQIFNHVVHVKVGDKSTDYTLLPSGDFAPPAGSAAVLTQSGAPAIQFVYGQRGCVSAGNGGYPTLDFSSVTFSLVGKSGDTLKFNNASQANTVGCYSFGYPDFKATSWSFPDGNVVQFSYTTETLGPGSGNSTTTRYLLNKVSNSFGRSLTFAATWAGTYYLDNQDFNDPVDVGWVINSVTDENGRVVNFTRSNCPTYYANHGASGVSAAVGAGMIACNTLTATTPDNQAWTYSYAPGSDSPDPSLIEKAPYHLRRWYTPLNATSPFEIVTYDALYRTASITDANSHVSLYYPSSLFPTDLWKRTDSVDAVSNMSNNIFDRWNDLLQSTNPLGAVTTFAYDAGRRKILETKPEGNTTAYTYDVRSNLLTTTESPKPGSSLGQIVTSTSYEEGTGVFPCADPVTCNKPASTTDALGNVTSYSWNGTTGQITQVTSPADSAGNQPQTNFTYTAYTGSDGNSLSLVTGSSAKVSTSATFSKSFAYGTLSGHLTLSSATIDPSGFNLTTGFIFTAGGDLAFLFDARGNEMVTGYDAMRRITAQGWLNGTSNGSYPWIAYNAWAYDAAGELLSESHATGFNSSNVPTGWETWQTAYTPTGKVASKTDPLGDVTNFSYDADDRTHTVTDPTSYVTQYVYDAASQKLQEQRAVGTSIQQNYATFTYSANGNVLSETDSRGNAIRYAYDGFDRPSVTTYADNTTEQNQYDARGEVTIWTNRAALSQIRCYDNLGRKTAEQSVTGATNQGSCPTGGTSNLSANWYDFSNRSFTYDLLGRTLTANTASGWNITYTYDTAGRPLTSSDYWGTFTYGHDANSNLVSIQYPTGDVAAYGYDALNRMTSATLNGNAAASLYWDVLSRRTSVTYGDGSSVSYGYDAADRLTSLGHVFPNGTSANVSYGFGYDAASRLTSRSVSNSAYEFSTPVTAIAYAAANTLNEYPSVSGTSRTYGPTGALSTDGVLNRYYDQAGMMAYATTTASGGAETISGSIDALGRVDARGHDNPNASPGYPNGVNSITFYSYGAERPEVLRDLTATAAYGSLSNFYNVGSRIYVLGPAPDERLAFEDTNGSGGSGTIYYPHADRQGSTIGLSTGGQNVLTRTYDAYGLPNLAVTELAPGASAYPYLYTGQRYDPTLIAYDYKARIYSARDGRFWQTDPIGPKDDLNLYGYTGNSPLDGSDPMGTEQREATLHVSQGPGVFGGTSVCESKGCKGEIEEGKRKVPPKPAVSVVEAGFGGVVTQIIAGIFPAQVGPATDPSLQPFVDAATAASNSVKTQSNDPLSAQMRGVAVHAAFAANISAMGYSAEISYLNGRVVPYGTPGSVRADGVFGPIQRPSFVVDLKTGGAYVSRAAAAAYARNLPAGTSLYEISERSFP